MKHERKAPRRHLIYYLRVYDRASGQQLGHLVDLTTEGVMLVSEEKLEKGVHSLRMDLPAMGSRLLRLTPEAPHADAAQASARKAAAARRKAAAKPAIHSKK